MSGRCPGLASVLPDQRAHAQLELRRCELEGVYKLATEVLNQRAELIVNYDLYVESGPRQRKTMVHVLDLLGCIAQGPTTAEALEASPEAIRSHLRFLLAHGEAVDPESVFTTSVMAHVTEGFWIGNGDPAPGFGPDFRPLPAQDLSVYLRRLGWLRADLLELVSRTPPRAHWG